MHPWHHYATLFTESVRTKDLNLGKLLHSHLIKTSLNVDIFLANRLIEMYSKCDSLQSAQRAFDELPIKNTYSWNTIISAYSRIGSFNQARKLFNEMPEPNLVSYNILMSSLTRHGFYTQSIDVFRRMQSQYGIVFMDEFTLVSVVNTCACLVGLKFLRQVHGVGIVIGLKFSVMVSNALIDAYGKCGDLDNSYLVFSRMADRDVVSWTSMLVAYARALRLDEACRVFNQMPIKNTVSWTALISGFAKNGQGTEALNVFQQMLEEGISLSAFTYVSVLSVCADLALTERGKQLHGYITRSSSTSGRNNIFLSNALIDMYCKFGDMKSAFTIFERTEDKDIISWNSIITGFAQNGHGEESLAVFKRMLQAKMIPNHVTFLGALSACCHTGLVSEGLQKFYSMERDFGVIPRSDHYAVLIDLLGRKNRLKEALDLIVRAPNRSDHVGIWGALLAACRVHGHWDLAERAAEALFELEPENSGRYVMLSNIYAAAGKWDDAHRVRRLMFEKGLWKDAGLSWINVRDSRHEFVAKDKSHDHMEQIYELLHKLVDHMSNAGYLPEEDFTFFLEEEGV